MWCRFGVCLTLCLDLGSDACMKRVVERYAPQMYAPDAIFFSKHQITAQQIERDVHAIEAHSLCGAHSFLICSCSSCSRSLQYRYVFFVQVPGSATGSDKCWTFGVRGSQARAATAARVSTCCTHSRRARARAIADGSREPEYAPHLRTAPFAPAARSSHHCVCQVPCKSHQAGASSLAPRHC